MDLKPVKMPETDIAKRKSKKQKEKVDDAVLMRAWTLMCQARAMAERYDEKKEIDRAYTFEGKLSDNSAKASCSCAQNPKNIPHSRPTHPL